jgi:4-amino-4-deoxy-L-arabinose transferase-like glycosyltransferase
MLHWLIGVATVVMVFELAICWGLERWSFGAALLVCCDPILLNQSTEVMTETLATLLAASALLALTAHDRRRSARLAALAGLIVGLAALCRPTFLPWLAVLAVVMVVPGDRRSWMAGLAIVCGAALVLGPWAVRNRMVLGAAKLSTTHGGYTLLLGNNPSFYAHLRSGREWSWDVGPLADAWRLRGATTGPDDARWERFEEMPSTVVRSAPEPPELESDAFAYRLARRYITEDLWMFVRSSVHRVLRLWGWTPERLAREESTRQTWLRRGVAVWYFLVSGAALGGVFVLGRGVVRRPWCWGVLLCLVFTAVHVVYWSNMRMRAPCVPVVSLLAAAGLARASTRLQLKSAWQDSD